MKTFKNTDIVLRKLFGGDFSISELENELNLDRKDVNKILVYLQEEGLIKKAKNVAETYKITNGGIEKVRLKKLYEQEIANNLKETKLRQEFWKAGKHTSNINMCSSIIAAISLSIVIFEKIYVNLNLNQRRNEKIEIIISDNMEHNKINKIGDTILINSNMKVIIIEGD